MSLAAVLRGEWALTVQVGRMTLSLALEAEGARLCQYTLYLLV